MTQSNWAEFLLQNEKREQKEDLPFLKDALALWRPEEKIEMPVKAETPQKRDVTITPEHFDKLDEEGAKLLKDNKVSKITVVGKGDHDLIVVERPSDLAMPMDASTGCRKITVASKVAAELIQKENSIELRNIRGLTAEVDPGNDPILGIPLPWVTASVSNIKMTKGEDGKYSVQVTGKWGAVEKSVNVALPEEQVERLRTVLANLDKLRQDDDNKQLTKKVDENKLLEGVPEANNKTWTDTALDIALYTAGGLAALKVAQVVAKQLGIIGNKKAEEPKADEKKTEVKETKPKSNDPKPEASDGKDDTADRKAEKNEPKFEDVEKLAALQKKADVDGLKDFALKANNREMANKAVEAIIEHAKDPIPFLRDIARSDSYASGYAMRRLCTQSEDPADSKIALDRWNNGEILKMLKEGKASARDVLDALEWSQMSDKAAKQLMTDLAAHPEAKAEMCRAMLAKDFVFNKWELSEISTEMRLKAAQHLVDIKDPGIEKTLLTWMSGKDPALSEFAKKQLETAWSNEPGDGSRNKLQDRRLKDFVEDLGKRPWGNAANAPETYKAWKAADKAFGKVKSDLLGDMTEKYADGLETDEVFRKIDHRWGDDKYMEEMMKNDPDFLQRYKEARAQEGKVGELRTQVETIARAREAGLRPLVESYCKSLGIPTPDFNLVQDFGGRSYRGTYQPGHGTVNILESLAMTGDRPSPEFMNTLFHELAHAEQDALIIRRIADQLGIGLKPTDEQRKALKEEYLKQSQGKTAPTEKGEFDAASKKLLQDGWIDKVMDKRNGEELSKPEGKRADDLMQGKREKAESEALKDELTDLARRMRQRIERLQKTEVPLFINLGTKPADRIDRAKKMLESDELPERVKDALDKLAEAEQANKPQEEIKKAELLVREELSSAMRMREYRAARKADRIYRERLHEVESHDVGRRTEFFGRNAEAERKAAGEAAPKGDPIVTAETKVEQKPKPPEGKPSEAKVEASEVKPGGEEGGERKKTSGRNRGRADEAAKTEERGKTEGRGDTTFVTDRAPSPEVRALLEKWKGDEKILERDLARAIDKVPAGEKRTALEEQAKLLAQMEEGPAKEGVKRAMAEMMTEARKPGFRWDSAVGRAIKVAGAGGVCIAVGMLVQVLMENEKGYHNFRGSSATPDFSGKQ